MKPSRPSRFIAAFIALVSMLFMQFAVASYACPDIETGGDVLAMSAGIAHPDMPGCAGRDMAQPNLCDAHDKVGSQSLDKPQLPQIQPFIAIGSVLAWSTLDAAYRPATAQPEASLLTRATAPPLSIRNCCFRI